MIRQDRINLKNELTQTVQYCELSSSKPIAVCKLNPLPATPFAGQGMLGRPVGWALATRHKALFSANIITEVSMEAYDIYLHTLQFF